MRTVIVTPAEPGSLTGNRVTAERWAQRLTELAHDVRVFTAWDGESAELAEGYAFRATPSFWELGPTSLEVVLSEQTFESCE